MDRFRTYEYSSIHSHPDSGVFETHGGIRNCWRRLGWEDGFLGYPVSDEREYSTDDYIIGVLGDPYMEDPPETKILGRCSFFQGGCIVWLDDPRELGLLLRPNGLGTWLQIDNEPEKNIMEKLFSFLSIEKHTHINGSVHLQDIPLDFGRSIFRC